MSRPRIIAIGNALRGDDTAGPAVAERLRTAGVGADWLFVNAGDAAALVDLLRDQTAVVLIDAMRSGAAPGTIVHIDAVLQPLATGFARASSHGFGIAEAIELCRALDVLPARVEVIGIEGAAFEHGESLTPAVAQAVEQVAADLLARIAAESRHA